MTELRREKVHECTNDGSYIRKTRTAGVDSLLCGDGK